MKAYSTPLRALTGDLQEGSLYAHLSRLHENSADAPRLVRRDGAPVVHQGGRSTLYEVLREKEENARPPARGTENA
jgi:hypothetical protein